MTDMNARQVSAVGRSYYVYCYDRINLGKIKKDPNTVQSITIIDC
jgi:hypothetical protein